MFQPRLSRIISMLLLVCVCALTAFAQGEDRQARAAQWDAYALPTGEFTRFVNKEKGYALWHPAGWESGTTANGHTFAAPMQKGEEGRVIFVAATEDVPDGFGLANYTSATLQSFRKTNINEESVVVRRVLLNGLEWREIVLEMEEAGTAIRQTFWMTVVGPRAYLFAMVAMPEKYERYEPLFKHYVNSVMIGVAGHWDETFETLRARFPAASAETEPLALAAALRAAREPLSALMPRLQTVAERAPAAVFDLCADPDPHVRAAALNALSQTRNPQVPLNDVLLWATSDKEATVSLAAARALRARDASWLAVAKQQLHLFNDAAATVRLGASLETARANELLEALWQSENDQPQLAGLRLALALPQLTARVPYAKLFNTTNPAVLDAMNAVIQRHRPADAMVELTKLRNGSTELWAMRSLGEVAALAEIQTYKARLAALDKSLEKVAPPPPPFRAPRSKNKASVRGRVTYSKPLPPGTAPPPPPPPAPLPAGAHTITTTEIINAEKEGKTPATFTKQAEIFQLSRLREAYVTAIEKVEFRDRWEKASDETARQAVIKDLRKASFEAATWARGSLLPTAKTPALAEFDATRFQDAPTTGETLFPARATSYVMAPNFAATLDRLDAALSGVQMTTVRDQMTFALLLNVWKTILGNEMGTTTTGDLGKALGMDLHAPLAVASWPAELDKEMCHAVTVRVTERARFERALVLQLNKLGGVDTFAYGAAALARFAGVLPGALPLVFALASSDTFSPSNAWEMSLPVHRDLPAIVTTRQEQLGALPITVIEQAQPYRFGGLKRVEMHVVYLGTTALVASSRTALVEALNAQAAQKTLTQNPAFARARQTPGEIVYFSELGGLLKDIFTTNAQNDEDDDKTLPDLLGFADAFGAETGALQLTPNSWEAAFHLKLTESDLLKSLRPFPASALAAPRELLPAATVLYGGVQCDPAQLWAALKKLSADSEAKKPKDRQEKKPTVTDDEAFDKDIEQNVIPQMQGEIAGAILSLQPLFATDSMRGEWPAMLLAVKLKSNALAAQFKLGKLFAKYERLKTAKALGAPVIALGLKKAAPYLTVTDQYLLLADSLTTFERLSAPAKFAATRDYQRSMAAASGELAFFATYNIEAAFSEAEQRWSQNDDNVRSMMPMLSAVSHAFHSQRLSFAFAPDGLVGKLAVSFDREGRYTVGAVANNNSAFDVANALIEPKGLNLSHATRVESLTLRVTAQQPGIAAKVRDDLSKFSWQRVESNNDHAVQFTTSERRLADSLTIKLPVKAPELATYLAATPVLRTRDPQIIALAQQIAEKDTDGRSVARKLGEWTFKNLKWKKVQSDVVETLASREADCLEHSELYVALARVLGLPARVVTGAAFAGGSFGAHAWVEVYLGKWVELDPTWGLLDHVDATHLRFEGNAFSGYAMLNQLQMEVVAMRYTTDAAQRDPLTLVKAHGQGSATIELAYDLALSAERSLGPEAFAKLNEKQRAAVNKAFDRLVAELTRLHKNEDELPEDGEEDEYEVEPPHMLQSEIQGDRATFTTLFNGTRFRFHLAARAGVWYFAEIENLDEDLPLFADAIRQAASGATPLRMLHAQAAVPALKRIDTLLAAGETPALLLFKVHALDSQEAEVFLKKDDSTDAEKKPDAPGLKIEVEKKPDAPTPSHTLLRRITERWPDYAPAYFKLAQELHPYLGQGQTPEAKAKFKQGLEQTLVPLKRYAELVPYDPRPWQQLSGVYEDLERYDEAEAALRAAITRDRESRGYPTSLVEFFLRREQAEKAKESLLALSQAAGSMAEAFTLLSDEFYLLEDDEGRSKRLAAQIELLLLAFPKELAISRDGLNLLAEAQEAQDKTAEALKTRQRVLTLKDAEAGDHFSTALLQIKLKLHHEALASLTQTLKLDDEYKIARFHRACVLTQLGRKGEALADLQKLPLELEYFRKMLDDEALKPLAEMPEFKALRDKK